MTHSAIQPMIVGVASVSEFLGAAPVASMPRFQFAVEVRLDLGDWRALLASDTEFNNRVVDVRTRGGVVVATCRRPCDGGRFDGTEDERLALLGYAGGRCDWVDLEDDVDLVLDCRVIRSHHDFSGMPDWASVASRLTAQPHDLIKIVGTANSLGDNLDVRDFLHDATNVGAFLMGEKGLLSRVLGHAWGSSLSYWALGQPVASGMVTLNRALDEWRLPTITDQTRVFGVVGTQVQHSHSPAIHNAWLRDSNADAVYLPLVTDDWADFERVSSELPIHGASVTIPFKDHALRSSAHVHSAAEAIGAANTIWKSDNRTQAGNTDAAGFAADLERYGIDPQRALVLGAGGASRAVVYALKSMGTEVSVWTRDDAKCQVFCDITGARPWSVGDNGTFDLVVNATPCGMAGSLEGAMALDRASLEPVLVTGAWIYDLVYSPRETKLIQMARAAGFRACNGFGMLLFQAAEQARRFGYRPTMPRRWPVLGRHVWLVGYRASGKTTVSKWLADMLGVAAIDTDSELEHQFDTTIRDWIGAPTPEKWKEFRTREREVVARVSQQSPAIIATGGGVVETEAAVSAMRESGTVVWLRADIATLQARLTADTTRPSLTSDDVANEVAEVLGRRTPLYRAACDIEIDTGNLSTAFHVASAIVTKLAEFNA